MSAFLGIVLNALLLIPFQPQQQPPASEGGERKLPPFVRDTGGPGPTTVPAASQPTGPMRVEPFGVQDVRVTFYQQPPERVQEPRSRFLFRLTGETVAKVDRHGKAIIEALTDDTGKDLLDPKALTDRDRTGTNPVSQAANIAQNGGIMLDYVCTTPPTRAAKKIAKVRGYVNIVFGGPTEEITIDNPMQFAGKVIDHPRLNELGVKVRVLKPGEESAEPADNRGIPLKIEAGEDSVRNVDLYDEWMKRMNIRPRAAKTAKDETYFYYQVMGGLVTSDTQLVFTVHKSVKREQVKFEATDLALP